jgi:hypothetical protein
MQLETRAISPYNNRTYYVGILMQKRNAVGLIVVALGLGIPAVTYSIFGKPERLVETEAAASAQPLSPPSLQRVFVQQPLPYVGQPGDGLESAAREFLATAVPGSKLAYEQLSVKSTHRTRGGTTIVTLRQEVEGIEIFQGAVRVLFDRENKPVAAGGALAPESVVAQRRGTFDRSPTDRVVQVFTKLTGSSGVPEMGAASAPGFRTLTHPEYQGRVKPVYFPTKDALAAAYYAEVAASDTGADLPQAWAVVVDAETGALLFRQSLVYGASYSYRTYLDSVSYVPYDSPLGTSATPHPTGVPDSYQPAAVPPNLITLQNRPYSRNDPWLAPGATQTIGNNVAAYLDLTLPWGYQADGDLLPGITAPGVFDYVYDPVLAPGADDTQRKAVATNLFTVTNFLHDWFYDSGFDELAGTPQTVNFGRGGLEGDPLLAVGQAAVAQSTAIVPADGVSPELRFRIRPGHHLQVTTPASVAGVVASNVASSFGPVVFDVSGELIILNPTGITEGCTPFGAGTVAGKIALLDRGGCNFTQKVAYAQAGGAAGVIIVDNITAIEAPALGGIDPTVTIPVMSVTKATGDAWKAEVAANGSAIQVTMGRGGRFNRDEALDNTIVAHEWAHVMVSRLIGNGSGLSNMQGKALAEGWADFVALLVTVREEDRNVPGNDQYQGVYAVGGYAASAESLQGHYFGIRRAPYSTNMLKNAFTFGHIRTLAVNPSTHPLVRNVPTLNAMSSNAGEIWALALWEAYVSLLNYYPFQEAQDRMKTYLVQSLMLTPVDPTFTEARDALLAAAGASDPTDLTKFKTAFAKRGLGAGAVAPPRYSEDFVGLRESDSPEYAVEVSSTLDDSVVTCDADGVLDVGETGLLRLTVRNTGYQTLSSFTGTAAGVGGYIVPEFPSGNTLWFPNLAPGASATRTLPVRLNTTTGSFLELHVKVTFSEPSLPAAYQSHEHKQMANFDVTPAASAEFTVEGNLDGWEAEGWERRGQPGFRYWHADDGPQAGRKTLTTPWIKAADAGNFIVSWYQRTAFARLTETSYVGGGVIEVSTDGVTWTDILDLGVYGGIYTAYLADSVGNPLATRPAMIGVMDLTPETAFVTRQINFGTLFAGQAVRLRFMLGSDQNYSAYGWDLDRIAVTNAAVNPFDSMVGETSDGTTCSRTPVAVAGPDQVVSEFEGPPEYGDYRTIHLYGGMSYDPDGQALTLAWQQVGGPSLGLGEILSASASFTAPVAKDQVFTFRLTASKPSGEYDVDLVNIQVLQNNLSPVARVTGPAEAQERTDFVVLSAAASSDPDGDALQYAWRQISGPAIAYSQSDEQLVFMAPEVTADTLFTFGVFASDGKASSNEAVTSVTIRQVDRAPSAPTAPTTKVVNERAAVTLSAEESNDPDGETLLFTWTQKSGPTVTITPFGPYAAFTAPDVQQDTTFTFELLVTAGDGAAAPVLYTVVVKNVNRAPVAGARWVRGKAVGETAVLTAASSYDSDLEMVTFAWKQVAGPKVALEGAAEETATFDIPEEAAGASLDFEVTVTDGAGASSTAAVSFAVAEAVEGSDPVTVTTKKPAKKTESGGCATGGSGSLIPLLFVLAWLPLRRVLG